MHPAGDSSINERISEVGYVLLPGILAESEVSELLSDLRQVLDSEREASVLRSRRKAYAARNLVELWPRAATIAFSSALLPVLPGLFGKSFGLVRATYFDKHPARPWSLPWHQDLSIAVKQHRDDTVPFSNPSVKRGVPHVEASVEILERMIAARFHLDNVTEENGPLEVCASTHQLGKLPRTHTPAKGEKIYCAAGDVLLMRPLLLHRSGSPTAGTDLHRRILHFDYSPDEDLPARYEWHQFIGSPE